MLAPALLLTILLATPLQAQSRAFTLSGATLSLEDATDRVEILFQSFRLNRAQNTWNFEVTLSNRSERAVSGPLLLSVDGFTGSSGPLQVDGLDGGLPPKPFWDLSMKVTGGALAPGATSHARTLTLGRGTSSPQLSARLFAAPTRTNVSLALTRSLNAVGQPLPGVTVEEVGPAGPGTNVSDITSATVTLGRESGSHTWKFLRAGHLPVWRRADLPRGGVSLLPGPRLTERSPQVFPITSLDGGSATNSDGSIRIDFTSGGSAAGEIAMLTPLDGQTLPLLLPVGWSPMQAFWLETSGASSPPAAAAALTPFGAVSTVEQLALVQLDEVALEWRVTQLVPGRGTNAVTVLLSGAGAYALVLADAGPRAPPAPQVGQPLVKAPGPLTDPASLTASGTVSPLSRPASRQPELVTAQAEVLITNVAGPLPSGLVLQCEFQEDYQLQDGTSRRPPVYDNFIVAYQRPGDATPGTLHARFPLRPLLLFGPEELERATLRVDVLSPSPFDGAVLDESGGFLTTDRVTLLSGAGGVLGRQAAQVRNLDASRFSELIPTNAGVSAVAGFELTIAGIAPERRLLARFANLPTNSLFVLARVVADEALAGVAPVERLVTDATGALVSLEPLTGDRLPGIVQSGQYLLLSIPSRQALVTGVARNSAGQPTTGLPVRVNGQPWLVFSGAGGLFRTLAPAGSVQLTITDRTTGDTGLSTLTVADPQTPVVAALATAAAGPRVISVIPTDGATRVSRVTPIEVTFSEPVNPASLLPNGIQLLGPNGQPVATGLTLNLANTRAILLTIDPLAPDTVFALRLRPEIADTSGLRLEGLREFAFTTETDRLDRGQAELIIFQPGATNIPLDVLDNIPAFTPGEEKDAIVVQGTPGSAEPERPVTLVNESTGQTSTTLSKPDGSFYGFIAGSEADFVSAAIVNGNGTRTYLSVSRQLFDNGFVGLYRQGGILEAESDLGPVELSIESGTVPSKTKVKLQSIDLVRLQAALGTLPADGAALLGGVSIAVEGDEFTASPDISIPIDPAGLPLPPGVSPEQASFALTVPQELEDGTVAYEIVDQMTYVNGRLITQSPPFSGVLLREIRKRMTSTKKLKLSNRILNALGLPGIQDTVIHQLFLPIMMASGSSLRVAGFVKAAQFQENGDPVPGSERRVPGAVVTVNRDAFGGLTGRLRPGQTFATAGDNGRFAFLLPADLVSGPVGVNLTATHPEFFPSVAAGGGTINNLADSLQKAVLPIDLYFAVGAEDPELGDDTAPPSIAFAQNPRDPRPGINVLDGVTLTISARDDRSVNPLQLEVVEFLPLEFGLTNLPPTPAFEERRDSTFGPGLQQTTVTLRSPIRARLTVRALANDGSGNLHEANHTIIFAGNRVFPPPTGDLPGPRIVSNWPLNGAAGVQTGIPLELHFSQPLQANAAETIAEWLQPSAAQILSASPSLDNRSMTVRFQAAPGAGVSFTLQASLLGANNRPFDQDPSAAGDQTHSVNFTMAPASSKLLGGLGSGGGVVVNGAFAYALERLAAGGGDLVIYDLSGVQPAKVSTLSLPGFPRDLVFIPRYSFRLHESDECREANLVAVVGGEVGAETFQYLWIIDVSNPTAPRRLAGNAVTLAIAALTKVAWSPPFIAYLESGADITSVNLVTLQTFLLGLNATPEEVASFPPDGRIGVDANRDGDFCDPGDTLPLPIRDTPEFFGKDFALTPRTAQRILDFDFDADQGLVGLTLAQGFARGADGLPDTSEVAAPAYVTAFSGLGRPDPQKAALPFNLGDYPKRVALFPSTRLLQPDGTAAFRSLALVSLLRASGAGALAVIDISDVEAPVLLNELDLSEFGIPQSILRRADGLLALAMSTDLLVLDPVQLLLPPNPDGHPAALVGVIPNFGSGIRAFASTAAGLSAVNASARQLVLNSGPSLRIVHFPSLAPFPAQEVPAWAHEDKQQLLEAAREPALLLKSRLLPNPSNPDQPPLPDPERHYYVLLEALLPLARTSLPLVVEQLNDAGKPLKAGGPNAVPVRLAAPDTRLQLGLTNPPGAIPLDFPAHRLGQSPSDSLFTTFLAGPFVLTEGGIGTNFAETLQSQLPRRLLRPGRSLWISVDPASAGPDLPLDLLARVSDGRLLPGAAVAALVDHERLPLILIPGVAGSHLENADSFVLNPVSERWPGYFGRFQKQLSLDPADLAEAAERIVASDLIRQIPEAYTSERAAGAIMRIYEPLIRYLVDELGYVEYDYTQRNGNPVAPAEMPTLRRPDTLDSTQFDSRPTLFLFPYDWRLDNGVSASEATNLLKVIEFFHPGSTRVDILAHSMGGLVARRIILDNPGKVRRCVTLGSPFLGAPKAIGSLELGDFDSLQLNIVIRKPLMKRLAEYFPGAQQLLPSKAYFELGGRPLVEAGWDINENGIGREVYNYDRYRIAIDQAFHTRTNVWPVATNETFHSYSTATGHQDDWRTDNSGVDYIHVFGVQSQPNTIVQVKAVRQLRALGKNITDLGLLLPAEPETEGGIPIRTNPSNQLAPELYVVDERLSYVRGQGDGTVPVLSAARVQGDLSLNAPGAQLVPLVSPGPAEDKLYEHNNMLSNRKLLEVARDALFDGAVAGSLTPQQLARFSSPIRRQDNGSSKHYLVEVVNAQEGSTVLKDPQGQTTRGVEFSLASFVYQSVVRIVTGGSEDPESLTAVQFNIPSAPGGGTYQVELKTTELPLVISITELENGVAQKRTLKRGLLYADTTDVTLTIDSASGALSAAPSGSQLLPDVTLVGEAARDDRAPSITLNPFDGDTTVVQVTPSDDTINAVNEVFIATDIDGDTELQTELLARVVDGRIDTATLDARPHVVVGADQALNVGSALNLVSTAPPEDACGLYQRERATIQQIVVQGLTELRAAGWLLDFQHVRALEQGSGACLWRTGPDGTDIACAECPGLYTPKTSDHDIELFLECYAATPKPNFQLPDLVHDPVVLEGDWYFRPPQDGGTQWIYAPPAPFNPLVVAKQDQKAPLRPADIIAAHLNQVAETKRDILPEVSFFPERYEWFTNVVLDLQPPPEFGPDPIGVAGLGRQLLLLKWLLEGEYLRVDHPDIHLAGEDLDTLWNRLRARGDDAIPRAEGFEWAELHQYVAFNTGFMLRTRDTFELANGATPSRSFHYQRTRKQLKSLGKAAIRTAAGLVAGSDLDNRLDALLSLSRAEFRAQGLRSFEEYILEVSTANFTLFGPYADRLDDWLKAKVADPVYLDQLQQSDCDVNQFMADSLQFIFFARGEVFGNHELEIGLLGADSLDRPKELFYRTNNLQRLRAGFPNLSRPGLETLSRTAFLNLVTRLNNTGPAVDDVDLILTVSGRPPVTLTTNLPAHGALRIEGNAFRNTPLFITNSLTDTETRRVFLTLPTPGDVEELNSANNWIGFETYILNVADPCEVAESPALAPGGLPYNDPQLSSPFRTPDDFDPGYQPGITPEFLAAKFREFFGELPEAIFVVGSRTIGKPTGDIDTLFQTSRVIDRNGADRLAAWDFFRAINPQLQGFIDQNGITGIGQPAPDNPNPRGLGYDPDDIPKKGTIDPIFETYFNMTRPGVRIYTKP